MKTTRAIRVLMFGLTMAAATAASAQPGSSSSMPLGGKMFVNVNGGAQTQARELTTDTSFPVYGQTAGVQTTIGIDGGGLFDLNLGYRFRSNIGAALGYTSFSTSGTAAGAASIPSPIFFNRPATVTIASVDAVRKDTNVYLIVVGFFTIADKVEASVFAGPSAFKVKQDVFSPITAANVPAGTQSIVTTIGSESKNAVGVNVGADVSYWFMKQVGAGVFARFNGATVDLPSAEGVKAGGFQVGGGIRLKF